MLRTAFTLAAGSLTLSSAAIQAQPLLTRQFIANLPAATHLAQPPGETRRLFVITKNGSVRLIRDGTLIAMPVLSGLSGIYSGGESGLLGLAFHPDFQSNGYMYILYQTTAAPSGTRLARYTLNPADPEVADPQSVLNILTINRPYATNHQGGWIGFGPDGFLYITSGNGGSGTPSQDINSLLGKVLRIDVNSDDFPADPQKNYALPPDNPWAGATPGADEVWATGLRNPWRASFDRGTGDLWIGDVGDSSREELDVLPASVPPFLAPNYGYPCMEGFLCTTSSLCTCNSPALTLPFFDYPRTFGRSIICGYMYRGSAAPAARGTFFFGDAYASVYSIRRTASGAAKGFQTHPELTVSSLYSYGQDNSGELYLCSATTGIYKIIPACRPNCDGSSTAPILNVGDFTCFLQLFAAGDPYANCDQSTLQPVLNVADFTCFLQGFAAGCP
jgi:hypothetical protein